MTAPSTAARGAKLEREQRHFTVRNVEVREAGDGAGTLTLDGYACVTESPYEITDWLGAYTEVVRSGAFARTLGASDDVRLLLNHEGLPLARTKSGTLRLAEDSTGLAVTADLEPRSGMVNDIRVAMERGDLDEMSFAFQVTRQEWSPDYEQRDIQEVKLFDVSVVTYPANPATSAALRGVEAVDHMNEDQAREVLGRLQARFAPTPDPSGSMPLYQARAELLRLR
jgi:HK97 family phage prohead protease